MKKPVELLFEQLYNNKPLFQTQQDLVNQLLSNPDSAYYIPNQSSSDYATMAIKIKSLVSQLLSEHIIRTLTPNFRRSLEKVIELRLAGSANDPKEVSEEIIEALKAVNSSPHLFRMVQGRTPRSMLFDDITKSSYIFVATARPFEINDAGERLTIHQFLIQDLFSFIENAHITIKYYRFNFPLPATCDLFWMALRKGIEKYIPQKMINVEFINSLKLKSIVSDSTYLQLSSKEYFDEEDFTTATNDILTFLNKSKYVQVFLVDAPIFAAPMIVTNPNDLKNCSAYIILENESQFTQISKLPKEDIVTWKMFLYDRLRTQYFGKPVDFK